jgi:hypothetical protein
MMLTIAAAIEGFWSSRHEIPEAVRFTAGGIAIILVFFYFVFAGRGHRENKR